MDFSSHHIRLLQQLDEQRKKDLFCDCHIMVEGQMFKAHRNILFVSSGYFKMLLSQSCKDVSKPTTATFDVFSADTFTAILDFVYSGKLPLSGQNVIEVMSAASYLQMTDVISVCKMFIKSSLDISEKDVYSSTSTRDKRHLPGRHGVCNVSWGIGSYPSNETQDEISECIKNEHYWNSYSSQTRSNGPHCNEMDKAVATTVLDRQDIPQLPSSTCSPDNLDGFNSEANDTICDPDMSNGRYLTEGTEAILNYSTVSHHKERRRSSYKKRATRADQIYATMPTVMGDKGGWEGDVIPSMRFKCPFCSHMVKRKADLKRHLRCHTGERPYPCKTCGKRFTRLEHVRNHFRTIHEAGKLICRRCKRPVTDESGQVVQEGTRRFRLCSECVTEVGVNSFSMELDEYDDHPIISSGDEEKEPPWTFHGERSLSEPYIVDDASSDMIIHEVVDSDEDIKPLVC
ncbi:zinc finger and BTB domain-containing protein 8A.2-like [Rhinoderma darwinii]|uniref:zinc finger and BTB domain-containing protein 8A.2-like n=1 Tax=Rhinoderma darwinii TaxID=43563 RepID=UPI003F676678